TLMCWSLSLQETACDCSPNCGECPPVPPSACISPTSVNFGDQGVGSTSVVQRVTITNCGSPDSLLIVSDIAVTGANSNEFSATPGSCPALEQGQSCVVDVTFSPITNGTRIATLVITDNTLGSPHLVPLSGNGANLQPDALISRKNTAGSYIGDNIYNDGA